MELSYYTIDDLQIKWGTPFNEVAVLLQHTEKFGPSWGWANLRCRCSHVFGLKATECHLLAPLYDRPVMQVEYQLAPLPTLESGKLHEPFMEYFHLLFGTPNITDDLYHHLEWHSQHDPSGVTVFSAKWLMDDVHITLSVYGGTWEKNSGPTAANVLIEWTNEMEAARPYVGYNKRIKMYFTLPFLDQAPIALFHLTESQKPLSFSNFYTSVISETDPVVREAILALYTEEVFPTPKVVQQQLGPNDIAVYDIPNSELTFVSNRWDTVILEPEEAPRIIYYHVFGERSPNRKKLEIKELIITDDEDSTIIIQLRTELERKLGIRIEQREHYQ